MGIFVEVEPERKPPPAQAQVDDRIDLQDILVVAGIGFAEGAAAVTWWPAALILAAVFCLGFAYSIERAKKR